MDEPAREVVKTDPKVRVDPDLRLFVGGPVDPQSTWVLMAEAQGPDDEQREICPGVLLSVSRTLTLELLQSPPSTRARVVVGCAAWGPGQLEHEIAASSWLTMDVDPSLIFGVPPSRCGRRRFAGSAPTRRSCRPAPACIDDVMTDTMNSSARRST